MRTIIMQYDPKKRGWKRVSRNALTADIIIGIFTLAIVAVSIYLIAMAVI